MTKLYGREALRRAREQHPTRGVEPGRRPPVSFDVPPDAPYEDPDSAVHVWTGEKWIGYDRWLATAPVTIEARAADVASPPNAECVIGDCGVTRVWLMKNPGRWLMFAGSRESKARRRDFASPYLAHAIRTAEQWYGVPAGGWRAETTRDA